MTWLQAAEMTLYLLIPIVDMMNTLADPRRPAYFDPMADGTYVGGPYGYTSPYANYSHLSAWIHDPTFPGIVMTYDEVQFYLAEAAARGFTVPETAETYYKMVSHASFEYWGVSADSAAAYIAKPEVAWDAAKMERADRHTGMACFLHSWIGRLYRMEKVGLPDSQSCRNNY